MKLEMIEDLDIRESIRAGMGLRKEAAELETRAKELKNSGNKLLYNTLQMTEDLKVEQAGIGSASFIITKRKSIDIAKFKLYLLQKDVSAILLEEAEKVAISHSESESVRFSPWKEDE